MTNSSNSDWARPVADVLGSFDLGQVDTVSSCLVRSNTYDDGQNEVLVDLVLLYQGKEVVLEFKGVQRARLPEVTRPGLQLGEPFLERVDRDGLERIRYRFTDELENWLIESRELQVQIR